MKELEVLSPGICRIIFSIREAILNYIFSLKLFEAIRKTYPLDLLGALLVNLFFMLPIWMEIFINVESLMAALLLITQLLF